MANPLYESMRGNTGGNDFFQRFMQFRKSFRGNPQQQVQDLLNSGRISQQQYNQAVQMARRLQEMMGIK